MDFIGKIENQPSILLLVGQYLYCGNCCCNKKSKGNNNSRTEEIDNMKAFDYEALDKLIDWHINKNGINNSI